MGKYFNVTVKPTITASKQTGAFADADVLFDWTAFDIPKGANRLISITSLVRGTNGADQASGFDFELFFAKSDSNGTAPTTLGDLNAAVDTPGWFNLVIGRTEVDASASSNDGDLIYMNVMSTVADSIHWKPLVLQGEPNSGTNVGYDKLYVAGIAKHAFDFSTNVFTTGTVEGDDGTITSLTVDNDSGGDPTATKVFAVGDVLHQQGDIVLGTVKTIADTTITFESGLTGGDLADSQEIYNVNPITLIFSFEK